MLSDFEALVKLCQARNVAVQTIKGITRGPWGPQERTHSPWYQPLTEPAAIARRALGVGPAWLLPQHRRRSKPAAAVLEAAATLRALPIRRRDGGRWLREERMTTLFAG